VRPATDPRAAIPRGIWVLGFVSLFMDVTSELIHSLLPVFMVTALAMGIVEGIAESTALVVKVFSGVLGGGLGKRKALAMLGYGLGALSKPLFALATTVPLVLGARFMDRVGKGIRGAPRDALVADLAPPEIRGAAFGLRQALDTVGASLAPLLAIVPMTLPAGDFRAVFRFAVVPAGIAVLPLGIERPGKAESAAKPVNPVEWSTLGVPGGGWFNLVAAGAVFTLVGAPRCLALPA
jgi:sugar phosphate permease